MPSFTIGRADPVTEDDDGEEQDSPARISSPPKTETLDKPATDNPLPKGLQTGLPFGTTSPCKFTFKMNFSPVSPSRQPKSPQSPGSPAWPNSPASPGAEAEDDRIHFEPLIPLPDKVEPYTGEEKELPVFCQRAKLYRFDKDAVQWKERGIGEMKILHNKDTKTFRLLMRREHVLKLCCNHRLTPEMSLKKMGKSEKAFVWHTAADFAEEETRPEFLSVKFSSVDVALEFERAFKGAQSGVAVKVEQAAKERPSGEGRQGGSNVDTKAQDPEGRDNTQQPHKETSPKLSVAAQDTSTPGFLFGSPSVSSLSFAELAKKSPSSLLADKSAQNSTGFPGMGRQLFGSPRTATEADETCVSSEGDGPHFEPIIALPDKIKVLTGEEDEEALFSHRAKLYRFDSDTKQWKERGVGEIKLLRSNRTGKIRVLMRRDQVLKVCANHQVTADTKLQPNAGSDKSWAWHTVADFAEEEPRPEQLAVRFKSADVAQEFKKVFDECLEILKLADNKRGGEKSETSSAQQLNSGNVFDKFKPKAGSWECGTCLVPNGQDAAACVACGTPKPEATGDKPPGRETSGFDKFKPKAGSWECGVCLVNNGSTNTACAACGGPGPQQGSGQPDSSNWKFGAQPAQGSASGFTFGSQPQKGDDERGKSGFRFETSAPGSGFVFGNTSSKTSGGFPFGSASTAASGAAGSAPSSGFVFDSKQSEPDSKPADASSGFVFGGAQSKADSTTADSSGSTSFVFGGVQGKSEAKAAESSSGFVFRSVQGKADSTTADSIGNAGFAFGTKSKTDSKPAVFGDVPSKADSTSGSETLPGVKPEQTKGSPWECEACYVNNSGDRTNCVACTSPKPVPEADMCDSVAQSAPAHNLGVPAATGGFVFGNPQNKADSTTAYSTGETGFVRGNTQIKTDSKPAGSSSGFVFGSALSKADSTAADSTGSAGFVFAGVQVNKDPNPPDSSASFVFGRADLKPLKNRGPSSEEQVKPLESASVDGAESRPVEGGESSEPRVVSIDLELVRAPEPTDAEVKRAEKLLLPKSFYLYEREDTPSLPKPTADKKAGRPGKKEDSLETSVDTASADKTEAQGASVFGGSSAGSLSSFASMAKSPPSSGNGFSRPPHEGFKGQGAQLFASHRNHGAEGEVYDPEAEQEGSDFQAIVSLPEVEQHTGEEDEAARFTHRAKLYRFDAEVGQWKERGVGDMKILQHKESGRARVLMRRDQIHKLCANHYITPNMELRPNVGSDRSWVWHAQDFSEEVLKNEQLAVKFRSAAAAKEFREVFYECRNQVDRQNSQGTQGDEEQSEKDEEESVGDDKNLDRDEGKSKGNEDGSAGNNQMCGRHEKKSQERECVTDQEKLTGNGKNAVETEADGAESEKDDTEPEKDVERPKVEEKKSEEDQAPANPSTGFLFGSPSVFTLSFKDLSTSSLLGSPPKETSTSSGSPAARSPGRRESEGGEESGAEGDTSNGDHVHFEPLIPLPEKVDVVTGEEDEEVVFQERCKLYRFGKETSQWKERGVGVLKLLREHHASRARVVMRRDQIHKLCANHLITPQMELRPNGQAGTAWTWQTLADVSDGGEGKVEQLAVRFKTEDMAQQFKEKFEECRDALSSDGQDTRESEVTQGQPSGDDDTTQSKVEPRSAERERSASDAELPPSAPNVGCSTGSSTEKPTCCPEISRLLEEI